MDSPYESERSAEERLFWRDEIPEVMFWLQGEGFGDRADLQLLKRFLKHDARLEAGYLDRLVDEGLLRRTGDGLYELTDRGRRHGERALADDFSDAGTHGATSPCGCGGPPHGDSGRRARELQTLRETFYELSADATPDVAASACGCGCCGGEPTTTEEVIRELQAMRDAVEHRLADLESGRGPGGIGPPRRGL